MKSKRLFVPVFWTSKLILSVILSFSLIDIVNLGTGTGEKEKRIALDLLHNAISIKKKSAWTKNYESLMRRHVELSVDIKDHATAKDGMHQYRNLCINVRIYCSPPIELFIWKFNVL